MRNREDSHLYLEVESFLPDSLENIKANIEIRPLISSDFAPTMRVETPRGLCENHPTGTKFKITVQVIDDENGLGPYLRVPPNFPYEVIR